MIIDDSIKLKCSHSKAYQGKALVIIRDFLQLPPKASDQSNNSSDLDKLQPPTRRIAKNLTIVNMLIV
ncbi:MAG: hypothetical protein OFPI_07300 [Osedax symbiont Rs2]|nr:MAG: hypothetical protein OFPI_07300 [Osedax symbiont Rs2]